MTKSCVFVANTPTLSELCSVIITLPQDGSDQNRTFTPQVIKCRELIFTEPDILATPLLGREKQVQLLLPILLYKTGRLQSRIQKMGIAMEKPRRVTAADFQACFAYTLTAKIAPLWNKVGEIFIQGRDFVCSTQKMSAVRIDVTVSEGEICLNLSAKHVRNPPINLEALSVCPMAAESFFADPSPFACIQEYSIENQWCSVLPSMKKGEVVSVRKQLPRDGLFHSYKDVKKYWKNMYGYRLPDTDEGMLYYQVYFKLIGPRLFTYPEVCLRSRDVTTFNCPDVDSVLQGFLADVRTKITALCGKKFEIRNRAMYVDNSLTSAQELHDSQSYNLTQTQSVIDRSQYRPLSTQSRSFKPWTPSGQFSQYGNRQNISQSNKVDSSNTKPQKEPANGISREKEQCLEKKINGNTTQKVVNHYKNNGSCQNTNLNQENKRLNAINDSKSAFSNNGAIERSSLSSTLPSDRSTSVVPNSQKPQTSAGQENESAKKIIPVFKSKPKPSFNPQMTNNASKTTKPAVPMFKVSQKQNKPANRGSSAVDMFSNMDQLRSKLNLSHSDTSRPNEVVEIPSVEKTDHKTPNFTSSRPVFAASQSLRKPPLNNLKPSTSSATNSIRIPMKPMNTPPCVSSPAQSTPSVNVSGGTPKPPQVVHVPTNMISSKTVKRKTETDGEGKAKKPRAKPKIQDDLNIEQLAALNQLHKANTATLAAWLKGRGVACKSKDKKEALIARIDAVLNITQPEA